jgi:hypothetical protein
MKKIYFRIYFVLLITSLTSCQLIFKEISFNQKFEDQYSDDIEKISQSRNAPESPKEELEKLLTPSLQSDTGLNGTNSFDYVGMSHFGSNQKKYFPDYETYEQGKFSNPSDQFSPKIFEIGYNTYLNQPFTKSGVEFDFIEIPESDSFGIKSSSTNKNYTLIPIRSLQDSIEIINKSKTAEDIEFSKKLIVDKKFLIRKKNLDRYNENDEYVKFFEKSVDSKNINVASQNISPQKDLQ